MSVYSCIWICPSSSASLSDSDDRLPDDRLPDDRLPDDRLPADAAALALAAASDRRRRDSLDAGSGVGLSAVAVGALILPPDTNEIASCLLIKPSPSLSLAFFNNEDADNSFLSSLPSEFASYFLNERLTYFA